MKTILLIPVYLYCLAYMAIAAPVKLAWDANPEPDVVSYRISYGQTADLGQTRIVEGTELTLELAPGTWHFAAQATNAAGQTSPLSPQIVYTVLAPNAKGWSVASVSEEQSDGYAAELAIDGDPATFWHTTWREGQPRKGMPHELVIDMGAVKTLSGFTHQPRQDGYSGSNIKGFDFYLSIDGLTWGEPVASGEIFQTREITTVGFPTQAARYFRLVIKSNHEDNISASLAEIAVIEVAPTPAPVPPSAPQSLRVVIEIRIK